MGGSGAGKTSLAKDYSKYSGIPYTEIDDIFWEDVAARSKRAEDKRSLLLQSTLDSDQCIIEGVFYKWLSPWFLRAEKIIVLNTPKWLRFYRIIKRALSQLLSEPKSYRITITNHIELIIFNHNYDHLHYIPTLKLSEEFDD